MKVSEMKKLPYTVFRTVNGDIWEGKIKSLPSKDDKFVEVYPCYSKYNGRKEYKVCNIELWNIDFIYKIETTLK